MNTNKKKSASIRGQIYFARNSDKNIAHNFDVSRFFVSVMNAFQHIFFYRFFKKQKFALIFIIFFILSLHTTEICKLSLVFNAIVFRYGRKKNFGHEIENDNFFHIVAFEEK